jgi:hypothetical protein
MLPTGKIPIFMWQGARIPFEMSMFKFDWLINFIVFISFHDE